MGLFLVNPLYLVLPNNGFVGSMITVLSKAYLKMVLFVVIIEIRLQRIAGNIRGCYVQPCLHYKKATQGEPGLNLGRVNPRRFL